MLMEPKGMPRDDLTERASAIFTRHLVCGPAGAWGAARYARL